MLYSCFLIRSTDDRMELYINSITLDQVKPPCIRIFVIKKKKTIISIEFWWLLLRMKIKYKIYRCIY